MKLIEIIKLKFQSIENALNSYLNLFLQSYKNSLEIMPQKSGSLGTLLNIWAK